MLLNESNAMDLIRNGRIQYRQLPVQQSLEDWNDFWSEYKGVVTDHKSGRAASSGPSIFELAAADAAAEKPCRNGRGLLSMRKSITLYGLTFSLPMLIWQVMFFLAPLVFLIALSFWTVKNFRMEPDFDTVNWVRMLGRGVFWDAYFRTLLLSASCGGHHQRAGLSLRIRHRLQAVGNGAAVGRCS